MPISVLRIDCTLSSVITWEEKYEFNVGTKGEIGTEIVRELFAIHMKPL